MLKTLGRNKDQNKKLKDQNKKLKEIYNLEVYGVDNPNQIKVKQSLWPLPKKIKKGSNTLKLPSSIKIICSADENCHIWEIADLISNMIFNKPCQNNGFPIKINFSKSYNIPKKGIDESYTLSVSDKQAIITAQNSIGASYGLMTFANLVELNTDNDSHNYIPNIPWDISDSPRFGWRGVMIDTARNYIPFSYLLKLLDGLFMNKMNVLHWHIVDAQSFPLLLENIPELAQNSAYSNKKMYNKNQIQQLIKKAATRGIRVICEIDMPGHSTSWGETFPDIMLCKPSNSMYNQAPWALEPPSGALNSNNSKTYEVVKNILTNVVKYFPDEYIHVGGDEVSPECWGGKNDLDVAPLMVNFVSKVHKIVEDLGKKPMNWEETARKYPGMENKINKQNTIINAWQMDPLPILKKNWNIIDTPTDWYLDCGGGNWVTGSTSWCAPYKTWFNVYNHDPHLYFNKNTSQTEKIPNEYLNQILGGTACLWTEEVDFANFFVKLFPRLSAIAERLWSPADTAGGVSMFENGIIKQGFDMSKPNSLIFTVLNRLRWSRNRLVRHGIKANILQPEYCYNNPDYCNRYCFAAGVCPCTNQTYLKCPSYVDGGNVKIGDKGKNGKIECQCSKSYPGQKK
jgi:hexosaminidase